MNLHKRILVLGCPGSGKSFFSDRLHEKTGIPLVHLDNVWWRADRTHITREEFDRQLESLLKSDQWILDGDYSRTYETRIRACDLVFFLDFSEAVCMDGIMKRVGMHRADLPWIESDPDPELVSLVQNYRRENRRQLYALFDKYPDKQRIVFRSRSEADNWLQSLD